jgi:hypothetical protein
MYCIYSTGLAVHFNMLPTCVWHCHTVGICNKAKSLCYKAECFLLLVGQRSQFCFVLDYKLTSHFSHTDLWKTSSSYIEVPNTAGTWIWTMRCRDHAPLTIRWSDLCIPGEFRNRQFSITLCCSWQYLSKYGTCFFSFSPTCNIQHYNSCSTRHPLFINAYISTVMDTNCLAGFYSKWDYIQISTNDNWVQLKVL